MNDLLNTALGPLKLKGWLIALAVLGMLAGVIITIASNRDERMIETAKDSGAAAAVITGQHSTLEQVERANDAQDEIARSGDAARYERCLRNASPASRDNCIRFKPVPD